MIPLSRQLKLFIFAFILAPILDFLWLGLTVGEIYKRNVGIIMRLTPEGKFDGVPWATAAVYCCMALGMVFFVLPKAKSIKGWFAWGAFFGFVLYGTYDFTNFSLLRNWTLNITFLDILWGCVLCGVVSAATGKLHLFLNNTTR